jgi:SPP1 gp7 family putative phage head morphogenesis protein
LNKHFVNIIYKHLGKAIDAGYKTGIRSVVKRNKKELKFRDTPLFDVDYTSTDEDAILNFKRQAFKVAGVGTWELEEELKKLGVDILESSLPDFDGFELAVRQAMLNYGIGLGDQPPSGWIQQNIDTAIKNSIAGARWNRANDPEVKGLYTHWMYRTQKDDRVRDEHVELEGAVFAMDDPVGALIFPPNDWGCRCFEEYLTGAEAQGYEANTPTTSRELLRKVPEDFRYNPGDGKSVWKRWLDQKFNDMPESEYNKLKLLIKQEFN